MMVRFIDRCKILIRNSAFAIANEWRSQPLSWLANFATLCGLAIAVYALVNPATVARYLDDISSATQSSAKSLTAIEGDTALIVADSERTATATETLASALMLRPQFSAQFLNLDSGQLQIKLRNQTPQIIRDLGIFATYRRDDPQNFGPFVLPPSEELAVNINGVMPTKLCYRYQTTNTTEPFVFEERVLTLAAGAAKGASGHFREFVEVATARYVFLRSTDEIPVFRCSATNQSSQ